MRQTRTAQQLHDVYRAMPPVIYATDPEGRTVCMVPATGQKRIAENVTADEMNDLWRASPAQRSAAQAALQYGWLHSLADPRSYNEKGERL